MFDNDEQLQRVYDSLHRRTREAVLRPTVLGFELAGLVLSVKRNTECRGEWICTLPYSKKQGASLSFHPGHFIYRTNRLPPRTAVSFTRARERRSA